MINIQKDAAREDAVVLPEVWELTTTMNRTTIG